MAFKTSVFVACFAVLVTGCKYKIAIEYNDMVVKKQRELGRSMDEAGKKLSNYFASFEYDSIVGISSRMETKIDSIIIEIKNRPAPKVKEGENFKRAVLRYFDFMKNIYSSYKNYGLQTTAEGRAIQRMIIPKVIGQEDQVIADMKQAQRIFAKDNGFKIKPADNLSGFHSQNR